MIFADKSVGSFLRKFVTEFGVDFDDYVKQYFGYAGGFASLFDSAGTFEIGEGFNEDKLLSLINSKLKYNA